MPAYYPFRAFKNRPYFKEFMDEPRENRKWSVLAQLALFRTGDVFGRETKGEARTTTCMMAEAWLSSSVAQFFGEGQAIFHIAPTLREAFLTSDLGDARVDDLKMPFETVYVHLGTDLGMTFNNGAALLEGVFLTKHRDKELSLTLVGTLTFEPTHWGERGLESFSLILGDDYAELPLLEALAARLESESVDPRERPDLAELSQFSEAEQADILKTWASHAEEREFNAKNRDVVLDCVKLATNALLYISHYPEDVEQGWQDGTPKGFQEKFARSTGKVRERTLSKAQNAGYTILRHVGRQFGQGESTGQDGASPTPHLRRAHWRRQAYGPAGSLRKLMWIRAVKVLGGAQRARPYLVAGTEGADAAAAGSMPQEPAVPGQSFPSETVDDAASSTSYGSMISSL